MTISLKQRTGTIWFFPPPFRNNRQMSALRGTVVVLSRLNPQTNQYEQMGKTTLAAMKNNGKTMILFLNAERKPILGIEATPTTDWQIQNLVYATFVDPRNMRWLIQFINPVEAVIFTIIALSIKLANTNEPILIKQGNGKKLTDSASINYQIFDLSGPIQNSVEEKANYTLLPTETTNLKSILSDCEQNGNYLVHLDADNFAVVIVNETIPETTQPQAEQQLPSIQQNTTQSEEKVPAQVAEAPQNNEIPDTKAETKKEITKVDSPKSSNMVAETTKSTEIPKGKVAFDDQLEQIRQEMNTKFSEITKMVASLKRAQATKASGPQPADILVASVQRLVRENREKDRLIAEKQDLIDMLNARRRDTSERDALRKKLADVTAQVAAQREETAKRAAERERLEKAAAELRQRIAGARAESDQRLSQLRGELEQERARRLQELDQQKQQLQWAVKRAEDEVGALQAQLAAAQKENAELKERTAKDAGQELEKLRAAEAGLVDATIRRMVGGVFQVVQANFNAQKEYDGAMVIKGVRIALQNQAEEILEELE